MVFSDSAYRIPFVVSNSDSIELKIDPNVGYCDTQLDHEYFDNSIFFPGWNDWSSSEEKIEH